MAHRTARLNVFGRQLLVTRVELDGWSVAKAAEAQGVSRQTAHKWVVRYRAEGWPGLEDRTSRPHYSPRLTRAELVEAILRARVERRWGPHRIGPLVGAPASTVYAVLARAGYSRLRDADRLSGVPSLCPRSPGLARPPRPQETGSHPGRRRPSHARPAGRAALPPRGPRLRPLRGRRRRRDPPRLRCPRPAENASTAARTLLDAAVWFARQGVRIERVLTDNAWAYTSPTYERAVTSIDARHKRTRPHRPQTNGKAERFIKTLLAEWAYGHLYRTNDERLAALPAWVAYYNAERTHTALGGITPKAALVNNLRGNHS